MGSLDIRLLLRQLRRRPEENEDMEHVLVEWFKQSLKAGRPGRAGEEGKLTVRWPSGRTEAWENLATDRYWVLCAGVTDSSEW